MPETQDESGVVHPPRSISETLTEVVADTSSLVRTELTLAGIETRDNVAALGGAAVRIAIGALLLLTAVTFFSVAGVVALATLVGMLFSLLIVAGVLLLLGIALIVGGKTAASTQKLLPMQSLARIAADIDLLQARAESIRSRGNRQDVHTNG